MRFSLTLQDKFGIFIAAIVSVVIAGLSYFFFLQLDSSVMDSVRAELVDVSSLVSNFIDPDSIPVIIAGGEKSKEYKDLKKYLRKIQLINKKIKSIYVMVKTNKENVWKFVADGDFDLQKMVHLNEEYNISNYPEMKRAFYGPIADQKMSRDIFGRWISGYAPIYDRHGKAVAIVGVDMSAEDVGDARERVKELAIMGFAVGLALAIVFGRLGAMAIANPIMALVSGVKNIEEGKYGYKINIRRKDEIGNLVDSFNRMSDKLSEVDKLKFNFLSILSHELYTPITPIKDSASQLLESGTLSDDDKQLAAIINRQIKKMQSLIDEILDFSWLEIREWKLDREPVSLGHAGEEALEQLKSQAEAKSIKLKLKLGSDLPTVMADKKRVIHVLKILLDNAIKFTPQGGEVLLDINRVSGGVELVVADTGIGIAKENLEKIFTSFYQVEDYMTRTKGGMGVGLAIAKRIVEAHNGYIWAESQGLGEGSRFVFLLPVS